MNTKQCVRGNMEDLKALMERPECCWGYIDELRMAMASACKERDELKKQLHEAKNELCYLCGKYREAHNGACDGCRWKAALAGKGGEDHRENRPD